MKTQSVIFANDGLQPVIRPELAVRQSVRLPIGKNFARGTILGQVSSATPVTEVKTITITGTPTGGNFYISFAGLAMLTLAYNATTAAVQAALETWFGSGNVTVSGTPTDTYTVTFAGDLLYNRIGNFTVAHAFTGGTSPAIAVANTTPGSCGAGQWDAYASGNSDGTQVARGILEHRIVANPTGGENEIYGGSDAQKAYPCFKAGFFKAADLTGLDSNCLTLAGWRTTKGVLSSAGHEIALGL